MSAQVRSASLTGFPQLARAVGLDPNQLLAAVKLPPACLETPEIMIPARAVGRLLELAATASRTQNFGLRLAETRRVSNLGAVALVAREEPTAGKAIEAVVRYQRLLNAGAILLVERLHGAAIVSIAPTGRRPGQVRQAIELNIGVVFGLLQTLLSPAWRPEKVCFMHEQPRDMTVHRRMFGMRTSFVEDFNGIVCDEADLDRPRLNADATLAHTVRLHLDDLLASRGGKLPDKVREAIVQMLPSGDLSLGHVAKQLGLEPRTLQRHLREAGQGFSGLADEIRGNLALQYMASRDRPLTTVANLLGFSELSAFSRWFKTKFNCSPTVYLHDRNNEMLLKANGLDEIGALPPVQRQPQNC